MRRLFRTSRICNRHTWIMRHKSKCISGGRKCNTVNPSSCCADVFRTECVERQPTSPNSRFRSFIHILNKCTENASLKKLVFLEKIVYFWIGSPSSEKDVIWMPVNTENGTANGLLEVFAHPPITFFIKAANADYSGTGSTSKFILMRRPSNKSCSSVQTKKNKSWFPWPITLRLPNIRIPLHIRWNKMSREETSWEQVTMRFDLGAQSTLVTSLSC